ncbi:MAG: ArsC/Spx/MgsR family protein [Pseudomonadota bacterium]
MPLRFYGLGSCDTCRKALKAIAGAGLDVVVVDVRADGVPAPELTAWIERLGPGPLVNTRSTTWRGLSEADRGKAGDASGAIALITAHPTLMKRPVIVAGEAIHIGWTAAVQAAVLGD